MVAFHFLYAAASNGNYSMSNIVPIHTTTPLRPTDLNASQLSLVKRTIAKDCNAEEFDMFIEVAKRVGLDPFRKQIYCIIYNKDKPAKRQMVLVTGIDGFRSVAARNENYRPDDNEPEIVMAADLKDDASNPMGIEKAVVSVYKQDNTGAWHRIRATAYWDEFAPLDEGYDEEDRGETWPDGNKKVTRVPNGKLMLDPKNAFWRKMPRLMLAKCAEAQALRKGWPEDLSGIYAPEELAQSDMIELSATEIVEEERANQRLIQTKTAGTILFSWNPVDPLEAVPLGKLADRIIEFVSQSESATEIETWRERNRVGLNEFWARAKPDALGAKKAIEARIDELSKPVEEENDDAATINLIEGS